MKIVAVVAVAENNAIGKDNRLLWRLPNDMKFFKEQTTGHCIVTGRKNYESIPDKFRPLPDRTNIVITRQKDYIAPGAVVVTSVEEAIAYAKSRGEERLCIIGGGEIYKQTLKITDEILYTKVHHSFIADTFFPVIDPAIWTETWREEHKADEKHVFDYDFIRFERKYDEGQMGIIKRMMAESGIEDSLVEIDRMNRVLYGHSSSTETRFYVAEYLKNLATGNSRIYAIIRKEVEAYINECRNTYGMPL